MTAGSTFAVEDCQRLLYPRRHRSQNSPRRSSLLAQQVAGMLRTVLSAFEGFF